MARGLVAEVDQVSVHERRKGIRRVSVVTCEKNSLGGPYLDESWTERVP